MNQLCVFLFFYPYCRILNKLTPEKFDKLCLELLNVGIDSKVVLKGIILLVRIHIGLYLNPCTCVFSKMPQERVYAYTQLLFYACLKILQTEHKSGTGVPQNGIGTTTKCSDLNTNWVCHGVPRCGMVFCELVYTMYTVYFQLTLQETQQVAASVYLISLKCLRQWQYYSLDKNVCASKWHWRGMLECGSILLRTTLIISFMHDKQTSVFHQVDL